VKSNEKNEENKEKVLKVTKNGVILQPLSEESIQRLTR